MRIGGYKNRNKTLLRATSGKGSMNFAPSTLGSGSTGHLTNHLRHSTYHSDSRTYPALPTSQHYQASPYFLPVRGATHTGLTAELKPNFQSTSHATLMHPKLATRALDRV